jgi:hypothetical protein
LEILLLPKYAIVRIAKLSKHEILEITVHLNEFCWGTRNVSLKENAKLKFHSHIQIQ